MMIKRQYDSVRLPFDDSQQPKDDTAKVTMCIESEKQSISDDDGIPKNSKQLLLIDLFE